MTTPQEKSRCCNRCFRSEDERMDLPYCANPSCPCHSPAATPLLMGICCEQCLIDLEYKGAKQCSDNDCLCHQPSPADTKVEDWAPTTRKFLRQFIPKCHTNGTCVGCDADMDAIINSISSLIEKVRQERDAFWQEQEMGVSRDCAKHCEQAYEDGRQEGIKMERDRWEQIYAWLNGSSLTDLFPERKSGEGAYWWRKPLRERVERIINPPSHPSV